MRLRPLPAAAGVQRGRGQAPAFPQLRLWGLQRRCLFRRGSGAAGPAGAPPDIGAGGGTATVRLARLDAAADRAIAFSARFPADDPWPAEIRNTLAYVLVRLERREDALAQLDLIGPYVTSFPWGRLSDDPLSRFLEVRDEVRAAASPRRSRRPGSGHTGRTGPGDH